MGRWQRKSSGSLKLQPADPFDLIRWLARSQSDPRKAVAELVQNSLDAGARTVTVSRVRVKGAPCLVVRDDGEGVLPALGREEALRYLATHVGHSHKLGLDPRERMKRVVAGKYGVGLLGFWAIGRTMELRSRVRGSPMLALELTEDSPRADIYELPLPTDSPDTLTEVVVRGVHESAQRVLGGRRLCEYLAAELRGQLLSREVSLTVHDGIARGLAQKLFEVQPRRYGGERIELPAEVEVAGHPPLRVELYLARGAERPAIQVACAGTLVADDVAELGALGLATEPWVGSELTGIIDFAGFNVPPGTRRGVMPDRAAAAFVVAMEALAPRVVAELGRLDKQRHAETTREVVRELRRALRGLGSRLPQYELPRVQGSEEPGRGDTHGRGTESGVRASESPGAASGDAAKSDVEPEPSAPQQALFPPGPLAAVRIVPPEVRVAPGAERHVRALAVDADGRALAEVVLQWSIDNAGLALALRGDGARPAVYASPGTTVGSEFVLRVTATQGALAASTAARVLVADLLAADTAALGIPEPALVSDPNGAWRSRMVGERWEVNDAHEDYLALRKDARARLRYLLTLLAREIALRVRGFDHAPALESLVEILAHAERNLRGA